MYGYNRELRRRREAAKRLPPLQCGCSDPLFHYCHDRGYSYDYSDYYSPTRRVFSSLGECTMHDIRMGHDVLPSQARSAWKQYPQHRAEIEAYMQARPYLSDWEESA